MIEVEIEDESWTAALPDAAAIVERAAMAVLSHLDSAHTGESRDPGLSRSQDVGDGFGADVGSDPLQHSKPWVPAFAGMSGDGLGLTVLLTDDATIRDLNARFRGKDAATNVLSFPAPETARPHLGDVALAHGVCATEAAAQGKSLEHHLMHLTAHGVLHLLGYDHQTDAEAEAMESIERLILADLGAPDPYRLEGQIDAHAR